MKKTKVSKPKLTADYAKKIIVVECCDQDNNLENLLNYIKKNGNGGHSFTIVVDPDMKESTKRFSWDGDGSDRIN